MNKFGRVYKVCPFDVYISLFTEYHGMAFVQIQAISRVAKYIFFLSEYLLRLGLFLMSSIILFYDSVSISDYRHVPFYARVMFLKKSYKLKLCKSNTKFSFKTAYFLGTRGLTTSSFIVYECTTSRHTDL